MKPEKAFRLLVRKARKCGMNHRLAMGIVDVYKMLPSQREHHLAEAARAMAWTLEHVEDLVCKNPAKEQR
jgi:hypothetical protein